MSEEESGRPSFWGPLQAAWRQGLKEVGQYLLPAFPDSARPIEEPGTMGNPTPVQVTDQLRGPGGREDNAGEEYNRMLDRYAAKGDREEDQQEMER
ncbi:hypothetical protein K2Y11_18335 [bacterium]|nr:hypothetical protein [bacterium]